MPYAADGQAGWLRGEAFGGHVPAIWWPAGVGNVECCPGWMPAGSVRLMVCVWDDVIIVLTPAPMPPAAVPADSLSVAAAEAVPGSRTTTTIGRAPL